MNPLLIHTLMRIALLVAGVLPLALPPSATAWIESARQRSSADQPEVAQLRWLAGCWAERDGVRVTEEQWMAPAGGAMVGMSRSLNAGRMQAWEALRIVTTGTTVSYIAQPNGQAPTTFASVTLSDSVAAFENPAHDFPQRIVYRRVSADSIVATISSTRDGRTRGMDIPMGRVRCGT